MSQASNEPIGYEPVVSRPANVPSKAAVIGGWVMGGLPALGLLIGGVTDILKLPFAVEGLQKAGFPGSVAVPLGVATVLCVVAYLVPRTAVFGAVLLTGYLGGAVAIHTMGTEHRGVASDSVGMMAPAFVFAALLWGGLLLREPRLRVLLPLRK